MKVEDEFCYLGMGLEIGGGGDEETVLVGVGMMKKMIVSNGVYRSIEHRAIVNSVKERLSVATFYTFNLVFELGPAHSLIGPNNPPIFRRVSVQKYLQDFFARKLDGKLYVDFMKVEARDDECKQWPHSAVVADGSDELSKRLPTAVGDIEISNELTN
ncbi:hypothetical protein FXO38_09258 [Capsicum annuum]|nr:hypothetical protein FXO38_09258 [Capsicum annuum]